MSYVLIVIMAAYGGFTVSMQDFSSLDNCLQAKKFIDTNAAGSSSNYFTKPNMIGAVEVIIKEIENETHS